MDGQHDDDMKHDDEKDMNTDGINDNPSHYPFRQLQHGDEDCDDEVDGQHDDAKDMSNSDGGIHDGSCMFKCTLQCFDIFCVLRRPTAFAARTMEVDLAAGLIFRTGI